MTATPEDLVAAAAIRRAARTMPCAYCGELMDYSTPAKVPTRDHIWPKAVRSIAEGRIGRVWCCQSCNIRKGDMMPSEWLKTLSVAPNADQGQP